jgi:hypothetical protein
MTLYQENAGMSDAGELDPAVVAAIVAVLVTAIAPYDEHNSDDWRASGNVAPAWRGTGMAGWRSEARLRGWRE